MIDHQVNYKTSATSRVFFLMLLKVCFIINTIILTIFALPVVFDLDFIVITGNILQLVNGNPIVKLGISLY